MKALEKIGLVLFSTIILILSIIYILLMFEWIDLSLTNEVMTFVLTTPTIANIMLAIAVIFILLAIKCIFFDSSNKGEEALKDGILLQNENGKLLISKDTLENLIDGIVKGFDNADIISSKVVLDKENNVKVFVVLGVSPDVVIKELSNNLQTKIKETIKATSDLDVKEVNIKVKNIIPKKPEIQG